MSTSIKGWTKVSRVGKRVFTRYTDATAKRRARSKSKYDHAQKRQEQTKRTFNQKVGAAVTDVCDYLAQLVSAPDALKREMNFLVLDGLYLCTTEALVAAGIPLSNIYICSRELECRGVTNFYSGELGDYLRLLHRRGICFSGAILDFCGTYALDQRASTEYLIDNHMLDAVSFMAITICKRVNTRKNTLFHQEPLMAHQAVCRRLLDADYSLGNISLLENTRVMTYIYKLLDIYDSMHIKTGYRLDAQGRAPDYWVCQPAAFNL